MEVSEYKEIERLAMSLIEKELYVFPLSFAQERLWFLDQLFPDNPFYNVPVCLRLEGPLNVIALEKTIREVILRHESLRTRFEVIDGEAVQVIEEEISNYTSQVDLQHLSGADSEKEIRRVVSEESVLPFNLKKDLMLRSKLLVVSEGEHVLLLTMHHIASDGWSTGILQNELSKLYEAYSRGELSPLEDLPIQYVDFAVWQRKYLSGEVLENQLSYWEGQLLDLPTLDLPKDRQRPLVQSYRGNVLHFFIEPGVTKRLRIISKEKDATLYMTLLAAFGVLLSYYSGQDDIAVGAPIANRNRKEIEGLIGFFVNTLVMRTDLSGNPMFLDIIDRVRKIALDAYANQDIPFEHLVDMLTPERAMSHNPLFDVLFALQNTPVSTFEMSDLTIRFMGSETQTARFDMEVLIGEVSEGLDMYVVYAKDLFESVTITRMMKHFTRLLDDIVENPEKKLTELSMFSEEESHALLVEWNDTAIEYSLDKCVHQLFEAQVNRTPDAVVLEFEDEILSYNQLNKRANQLASMLKDMGVGPDSSIGIMLKSSMELIMVVLGVMKAGAACLPIDPEYPKIRILTLLKDSGAQILITQEDIVKTIGYTSILRLEKNNIKPIVTAKRTPIKEFDSLPIPDRSLISYKKYHQLIGIAPAKHTVSLQASRGCPFNCVYCHKIWPKNQVTRSAENIFNEIKICYDSGCRRFTFIDDIFNLDKRESTKLLEKIIKDNLKIQLFFPNGLRGDILTKDYIDVLIEAGTVDITLAVESASPRIQSLIRKNLNLERFIENITYIVRNYPQIILELHMMMGFPTETEEEALLTFDFLNSLKWVHFPNLFTLKIFPNTDMFWLAIENGISEESIMESADLAYHELPDTLPFSKGFMRRYQMRFMTEYFLNKERLLKVLPHQINIFTEDELVQKYDSYLPTDIMNFTDILSYSGITEDELGDVKLMQDEPLDALDFDEKIKVFFSEAKKSEDAFRLLLLDLSKLFSSEAGSSLYDMAAEPLGLMYLMTYLNNKIGDEIYGKIAKSRMEFDSFEELKDLIDKFKPQVIGIRTLSMYSEFFHETVSKIKKWCGDIPIITGGPYATSEYNTILADENVDIVVMGEGEVTFYELMKEIIERNGNIPEDNVLQKIPGIAFVPRKEKLRNRGIHTLLFDDISAELASKPSTNLCHITMPTDLVYTLYTSGSTGMPKGVELPHQALSNLIQWHWEDYGRILMSARTLQFSSLSFDASFHEIFSTLSSGGTLICISEEMRMEFGELIELIRNRDIERLFLPFVALRHLADVIGESKGVSKSLRQIISTAEQLQITPSISALFGEGDACTLHNHYGPTESHVVTSYTLDDNIKNWRLLPSIGRPISNTQIYIVDSQHSQHTHLGCPGELHIGGICLARGYHNRPDVSAEKFIPNLYNSSPGSRLYKTGDLARYLKDRDIDYIGRRDYQIKIRGYRIELGEVESVLSNHAGVRESVVIAREDQPGNTRLVAYIVLFENQEADAVEIRNYLKRKLPDYMIPSAFVMLPELPFTPNGKVDRKRLPSPEKSGLEKEYVPPRTEVEKSIAEIWSEVLGVERIGIYDNFFEIGGHSLLATKVISRIKEVFTLDLQVRAMFEAQSIKELSLKIERFMYLLNNENNVNNESNRIITEIVI